MAPPLRSPPPDRAGRLGCLCELGGATVGLLVVTVCAFLLLPAPPPDALKAIREARGVYATMFGLGGFVAGLFAGSWVGTALRRLDRKE